MDSVLTILVFDTARLKLAEGGYTVYKGWIDTDASPIRGLTATL